VCLFVVTVIELTSSQSTFDVIQQENDVNSCERTAHYVQMISNQLNNVQLVISQLVAAVSRLEIDVAELKSGKPQNKTKGTSGVMVNGKWPSIL